MKERRMQILEDGTVIPCGFHNHEPHTPPKEKYSWSQRELENALEERTKEILEFLTQCKEGLVLVGEIEPSYGVEGAIELLKSKYDL